MVQVSKLIESDRELSLPGRLGPIIGHRFFVPSALCLILILAAVVRILPIYGSPLNNDEIHYAYDALSSAETSSLSSVRDMHCEMVIERKSSHPPMAMLLMHYLWVVPLDGFASFSSGNLRLFHVLFGIGTCLLAYFFGKVLSGRKLGLICLLLVSFNPALVWTSGIMYIDSIYTFFLLGWLLVVVLQFKCPKTYLMILNGLVFSAFFLTKISAPVLLPLFVIVNGYLFWRSDDQNRWKILVFPIVSFGVLTILLCDPGSYLLAIMDPTDPRYTQEWKMGGVLNYLDYAFIRLNLYLSPLFWDAPIIALLSLPLCMKQTVKEKDMPLFLLWGALLSLLPLFLMHHPNLSGPHGYVPIWLVLSLLFALVLYRVSLCWLFMGVFLLFSLTAVTVRELNAFPFLEPFTKYRERSEEFDLVSDQCFELSPRKSFLILDDRRDLGDWGPAVRGAYLAEAGRFFFPSADTKVSSEAFDFADYIILDTEYFKPEDFDFNEFQISPKSTDSYLMFERVQGERKKKVPVSELESVESRIWDQAYTLPGGIYAYGMSLLLDGSPVKNANGGSEVDWVFSGRPIPVPSPGHLYAPSSFEKDGVITFADPDIKEIFWGF